MSKLPVKNIKPGELHVSNSPCRITTLLGSCVSVTIHNKARGFGGMNHFMLPEAIPSRQEGPRDFRFGDISTRYLLDTMLKYDSNVKNLDAKIFGGGRVVSALKRADIGRSNIDCAVSVLAEYGLTPSKRRVEGQNGLKLDFNTETNVVKVKTIQNSDKSDETVPEEERQELQENASKVADILSPENDSDGIDFLQN